MIHGTQFWVLFFGVAGIVFILPTVIGIVRGVDNLSAVIMWNVFALVSLGMGWIGAMLLAFGPRREPPALITPYRSVPVRPGPPPDPGLDYIVQVIASADRLGQQRPG
jgi:hypothetical protein